MALGQSVPMIDARERVSGQIDYVLNLAVPGMLTGRILRSPHPHARVLNVDASRAERLPGVVAVLTRDDLLDQDDIFPYFGPVIRDQPIVAMDRVRFVGDPVAAVAAVDADVAEAALDLIDVEYEELPSVTDAEEALRPDAPVLHERFPRVASDFADVVLRTQEGTNQCNHFKLRKGDVEQGFAEADLVFEDVFRCPAIQHVPLEPHVTIGQVQGGKVTVWSGTQTPHVVRAQLAEVFKLPLSQVRVIVHTLGGAYGAKCYPKLEPLAAVLARKARRPVKLVLRREEDFLSLTKHAAVIYLKTGVKRDGSLMARQATCYFNTGAYADIGPRLIKNGGLATNGPYRIPHVKVDSYAVYTNVVPAGAFRGYGVSQAAWAYESQMDMIAQRLGMDPLQLRLKNVLADGDAFATGERIYDLHYPALLQHAAEAIDWPAPLATSPSPLIMSLSKEGRSLDELAHPGGVTGGSPGEPAHPEPVEEPALSLSKEPALSLSKGRAGGPGPTKHAEPVEAAHPEPVEGSPRTTKRRGRAITCILKSTVTPSISSAAARLNEDGSLNVLTSSVEMGQGARTTLAQIAAHYADVPLGQVLVSEPDTDSTPYDQTTSSSRTTYSMGRAITLAVKDVRQQLLDLAAGQLEASADDLVTEDGQVSVKGAPNRSLSYGDVVRKARCGNLIGSGIFSTRGGLDPETGQGIASAHWHEAAASCEVEVDTETGKVDILRFHAGVYAGRMVNPRQCELQTEGSTLFGLGQALFEEVVYDDGHMVNTNLSDYMIPSFKDVPRKLSLNVLEQPDTEEMHGIGETSLPPVMPVVANAVYDAVGVRITDLPITPEKVLKALQTSAQF